MNLFYMALFGLVAFIAIWVLFVAPAERRYHERKLALVKKRIEDREANRQSKQEGAVEAEAD